MGWVEARGKSYRANVKVAGQPQPLRKTFPTKTAARQWIRDTETDLARGNYKDPDVGAVLFKDWVQRWDAGRGMLKPSSRTAERGIVRTHLLPALGEVRLDRIGPTQIQGLVGALSSTRKPATVRNMHSVLFNILQLAVREGLIPSNPCVGTRLPENVAREMANLTEQQVEHLLACIPDYWRPLVVTLAGTGLRWGEAVGLKVGRVDLLKGELRVVETLNEADGKLTWGAPKTRRSRRTVSLPEAVVDALLPLVAGRGSDEVVFTSTEGGPVRHRNFNYRVWHPAVKAAGLEHLRPRLHDLRHYHATVLISHGVPLTAVQRRLGHESISITSDTYGHLLPRVDGHLLSVLNASLPGTEDRTAAMVPAAALLPDPG